VIELKVINQPAICYSNKGKMHCHLSYIYH